MKKIRILACVIACLMALSLCACAKAPENETSSEPSAAGAQLVNPVSDATADSLIADTGLDLSSADQFDNVSYYKIDTDDATIAGAKFEYNGTEYDYRVVPSVSSQDFSGMNYNWTTEETAALGEAAIQADVKISDEGAGVILWHDIVPGIMYSLSADKNATPESLAGTAGMLYVPVQGDADGDEYSFNAEFADKIYDLLVEIKDGYHPGTAGSSLTGAKYAAQMADLFAQYKPDPRQVTEAVAAFKDQKVDAGSESVFDEQIGSIAGSFDYITSEDGKNALEDAGYESAGLEWDESVKELFSALNA